MQLVWSRSALMAKRWLLREPLDGAVAVVRSSGSVAMCAGAVQQLQLSWIKLQKHEVIPRDAGHRGSQTPLWNMVFYSLFSSLSQQMYD